MQTGVDIIEIERVKKFVDKNEASLNKIFDEVELDYCNSKKNKYQHFAARFAAKEAVIKALGDRTLAYKDIVVKNQESGAPFIIIKNVKYSDLDQKIAISLSHCEDFAIAFVVIN